MIPDKLDEIIIGMSLETGNAVRLKIAGGSMRPLIGSNAAVGIRQVNKSIKIGDVIIFRSKGRIIAHRVVKMCSKIFITKGDASIFFDMPVHFNDIIGKVVFIESTGIKTYIDTGIWVLLNYMIACYSYACGIIIGRTLKGRRHFSASRVAINRLFPMIIYAFTRRL